MPRTLALLIGLGLTSCTIRTGSEMRRASIPVAAPAPVPIAATRPRTLHKRSRDRVGRSRQPAPPANQGASRGDGSLAQLCVDEINRYRATLGLRALERAPDHEGCADGQIRDDARSGHWHGSFGRCGESLQNECNSSPTDKAQMLKGCLRDMWNEGPGGGHYEAMKNASATKVWCGFYTEPSGGVWSVQDFK